MPSRGGKKWHVPGKGRRKEWFKLGEGVVQVSGIVFLQCMLEVSTRCSIDGTECSDSCTILAPYPSHLRGPLFRDISKEPLMSIGTSQTVGDILRSTSCNLARTRNLLLGRP
jgi:hypothetical protein